MSPFKISRAASLRLTLLATSTAALLGICGGSGSASDWRSQISDTYQGHIWSGGVLCSASTEFHFSSTGALVGSYSYVEAGQVQKGTLTDCVSPEMYRLTCRWNDTYGTDELKVRFAKNLLSFGGVVIISDEISRPHPPLKAIIHQQTV